jgi:hypothetical protein
MTDDPSGFDAPLKRSTDEARQGVTGHHVRLVLTLSLAGAVVALMLLLNFLAR